MLITREADYALRIIRSLSNGGIKSARRISGEQQIPLQFTHKIVRKLNKSAIIKVERGADGGCSLAKNPDDVSLYDLIKAVDGKTKVNSCMEENYICEWKEEHADCSISCQLVGLQERFDAELRNISVGSMMPKEK